MAQVLAVPGDRRHGFDFKWAFTYDFGRITGIAVSKENNVLLCDYIEKKLLLFDEEGKYLSYLPLTSSPCDVAISNQNIAYVTMPTEQCILQVDPDKLCICVKSVFDKSSSSIACVSAAVSMKDPGNTYLGFIYGAKSYVSRFYGGDSFMESLECVSKELLCTEMAIKLHTVGTNKTNLKHYSCVSGQNHFAISAPRKHWRYEIENVEFPTLRVPSDICSDDYGHIYVSGQYSHNIHRLTEDDKIIDIPLSSQHGIKYPVAMCFNRNYTKLYIVNEWGKSVMMFNVM